MSKHSEAYITLADIARRCRSNAVGIPEQGDVELIWSGIGFRLGNRKYVSPIPEIAEIIHTPKFTSIPGVQEWVRGVANVRGRLLPIMDLSGFVFHKVSNQKMRSKKVLIVDKQDFYSGIVVDEILGMQHFEMKNFSEQTENSEEAVAPYLAGQYQLDGEVWEVFSPYKLAVDPKFLKVAS